MSIEREITDPILATALDEIDDVLRRHKIAGAVCVASSTHAAFRLTLPEWSAVQIDKNGFRIKSSSERDGPEHLAASMHLVLSLRDMVFVQTQNLIGICEAFLESLRQHGVEVEHEPFGGEDRGGAA